jgi:hypothetical protein
MNIRLDADLKTTVPIVQPAQKQIQKKQQIRKNKTLEQTKQKHLTGKSNIKGVQRQKP